MIAITKKRAIARAKSGYWKHLGLEKATIEQLYTDLLFMPFDKFHEGIEKVLGRPVWTHELALPDQLREEYETGVGTSPLEKAIEVFND